MLPPSSRPTTDLKRTLLFVVPVLLLIAIPWVTHNNLMARDEAVESAWGNVESTMQRRADLIPNLVNSVREYMDYESETLDRLIRRRVAPAAPPADQEAMNELAETEAALARETRQLLNRAIRIPELRAGDQFLRLQAQLEGTENRINIARIRYNEAVRDYNQAVRGFIGQHVAASFGMEPRPYFEADEGASEPVTVEFD